MVARVDALDVLIRTILVPALPVQLAATWTLIPARRIVLHAARTGTLEGRRGQVLMTGVVVTMLMKFIPQMTYTSKFLITLHGQEELKHAAMLMIA